MAASPDSIPIRATTPISNALRAQFTFWGVWFVAYGVVGGVFGWRGIAMLWEAVDHVDTLWVKLVFLNVPLQLVLAVVTLGLTGLASSGARRAAHATACVLTALILAHVGIALATS